MVVVSGIWVKNVATYPTPAINDMVISNENKMTAKAVLICRPNSHPFQERTLALDQPVKVGRSVARARATATNAIFDCKVLSRHHALLWYENGKFYLQDTKSSNGTFVNNNRLAAETEHHEVSSGDIVQFGVDVIENNRKVTHGCIIATLKLFLPDGKEAKASPSIVENNSHVVPLDELYKLHQIIQEATQREQCLETKLTALQSVVDEARKSAEESWQAYVGEERLLSRVSALETQLQQAGKNWGEDKYREEVTKLQEDSATYQVAAKEALEKLHAERLQALSVATEQERCRISAEQEALLAREQLSQTQQELEVGSMDRGVAIGR
jgi:pSer/pThr/pTyr-binding forkhead associated (FHA) protein